jgi:hypothetical protein
MANVPSLKATLFQLTADRVEELVAAGSLSRAELERRLTPDDLQYLGKRLAASSWVRVASVARIRAALSELLPSGSPEAEIRAEGEYVAEMVHKLGLYRQFEVSTERNGAGAARILLTFASVAYNFSRWSFTPAGADGTPGRITVEDALEFPDSFRVLTEGFIAYMWRATMKLDPIVTSERTRPDTIVFTIREKGKRSSQ